MVYAKHLLSFWESATRYVPGKGCQFDQPPIKTSGLLMSFPVTFDMCYSKFVAGEVKHIILRDDPFEACLWFPQTSSHTPFPLLIFLLLLLLFFFLTKP
jgi:hypothetical protein